MGTLGLLSELFIHSYLDFSDSLKLPNWIRDLILGNLGLGLDLVN